MRELSSLDKAIIDRLVKVSETYNLQELQVARLLRKELGVFAVEWSINPYNINIYAPRKNGKSDFERIQMNFFEILDFLYLIEMLENEGFIRLQSVSYNNDVYPRQLYDKEKYSKEGNEYIEKGADGNLYFTKVDQILFNLDIVELLEKYANKIIFPLHSLKEFKERGYITEEQWFKFRNISLLQDSVKSAQWAAFASAIGALLTAISIFIPIDINLSDDNIDKFEEIINNPKNIIVDKLPVIDTLKIKSVDEILINLKEDTISNK